MLEAYYKYRMEYKDFLLFIKIGNFYEVFDKDSLILNKLFGYKIKKIKDSIKVGFSLSRLDYILKLIGNINYVIIDNIVVEKKEFNNNKLLTTEGRRFFCKILKNYEISTLSIDSANF